MQKAPGSFEAYDEMFLKGGYQGVYDLPTKHSSYYRLYRKVLHEIDKHPDSRILEVGCGTGGLSELIFKKGYEYRGFDFSKVAIEKAVQRTKRPENFWVGDALDEKNYACPYELIICTEVLEHVEDDLGIINLWKKGSRCICSVPNFDSTWHVRFFKNESEVLSRYENMIQVSGISRLKHPFLMDISLKNYIRHIIWNRYKPGNILKILGIGSFEKRGGWFVFVGTKI